MAKNALNINTNTNGAETGTAAENKRAQKAFITYMRADGTEVNFPHPDCSAVLTSFANGTKRSIDVSTLSSDIKACAVLQGVAIRTQRSYQALKDIDSVVESYDETVADLLNNIWIESKTGEPKVTMLSQAIVKTLEAAGGTVDDERRRSIVEKLKDASYREKAMANDHVKAALAQLKLDAAKERAAEAKKAAKESGTTASDLSDF